MKVILLSILLCIAYITETIALKESDFFFLYIAYLLEVFSAAAIFMNIGFWKSDIIKLLLDGVE